jgi:hypothetical protein
LFFVALKPALTLEKEDKEEGVDDLSDEFDSSDSDF